ncbi:hypothetical protein [Vibrio vulnificus]|uniref:hypothetical protein n=1 Tax=Vibrio vulnificus TaxID=672 RepID=UPI0019D464B7|nr:hypothetical protein [Vibrio vulnificus]MBN8033026.1 hypothetical protein [Vibrio vulnificus]
MKKKKIVPFAKNLVTKALGIIDHPFVRAPLFLLGTGVAVPLPMCISLSYRN